MWRQLHREMSRSAGRKRDQAAMAVNRLLDDDDSDGGGDGDSLESASARSSDDTASQWTADDPDAAPAPVPDAVLATFVPGGSVTRTRGNDAAFRHDVESTPLDDVLGAQAQLGDELERGEYRPTRRYPHSVDQMLARFEPIREAGPADLVAVASAEEQAVWRERLMANPNGRPHSHHDSVAVSRMPRGCIASRDPKALLSRPQCIVLEEQEGFRHAEMCWAELEMASHERHGGAPATIRCSVGELVAAIAGSGLVVWLEAHTAGHENGQVQLVFEIDGHGRFMMAVVCEPMGDAPRVTDIAALRDEIADHYAMEFVDTARVADLQRQIDAISAALERLHMTCVQRFYFACPCDV